MEELFSSTLFLPLRPRWWGGRTFIEEWNLSWWVLALIPLPLDPVTVRGAFIEGFVEHLAELILYAHSPPLAGGGAFIEELKFCGKKPTV